MFHSKMKERNMRIEALAVVMCVAALLAVAVPAARGQVPQGTPPTDEGHRGDLLDELADVEEAFAASPDDATRYDYASLLLECGSFEKARAVVEPLLSRAEPTLDAVHLAGRLAFYAGDYEEAELRFSEVLERNPSHARAYSTGRPLLPRPTGRRSGFRTSTS
jgi:Flp pilus assembly protein TadD